MTRDEAALAAAMDRYLAYLEDGGDAPTFDDLPTDVRRELDELIADLHAARGIDPYASRPSVEALVAGTEFEEMFRGTTASNPSLALDEVREPETALGDTQRIQGNV